MLTVYSDTISPRLEYILQLIFGELLGTEYEITSDKYKFSRLKSPKISYAKQKAGDELLIVPSGLLFEDEIRWQHIEVSEWQGMKIFYRTSENAEIPFDIFSAAFFLVSRYEEYISHHRDNLSRYEASESIAYKNGFLEEPVINQWTCQLKKILLQKFPEMKFNARKYQFLSTIDIDNAYAFKYKGFIRSTGALLRSLFNRDFNNFIARILTLLFNEDDPYNTYNYIDYIENKYGFSSVFFFLVGNYNRYDTNINIRKIAFRSLIRNIAADHKVGIHPSFGSNKKISILEEEIQRLHDLLGHAITKSRQHYLILDMPITYEKLINCGIEEDYSMGYATQPGFRAGICAPFKFYNLTKEQITDLTVYPFQIMDITLMQYLRLNPGHAVKKCLEIIEKIKRVDGLFISLWHNESLSDQGVWHGWRKVFETMVIEAVKAPADKD
jgi:hypothetical protein